MRILSYISLCIVCLCASVLFIVFGKKEGWKGQLTRSLTYLTFLIFAVVLGSLKSLTNALPMFLILAFGTMIAKSSFEGEENKQWSMLKESKAKVLINGILSPIIILFICLSNLSLSGFNFFSTLGGLMFGLGFGLIIWAILHEKKLNTILLLIEFSFLGLLVGVGYGATIATSHKTSAILMLIGGLMFFTSAVMKKLSKENKVVKIIANSLMLLSFAVMTSSIYFY